MNQTSANKKTHPLGFSLFCFASFYRTFQQSEDGTEIQIFDIAVYTHIATIKSFSLTALILLRTCNNKTTDKQNILQIRDTRRYMSTDTLLPWAAVTKFYMDNNKWEAASSSSSNEQSLPPTIHTEPSSPNVESHNSTVLSTHSSPTTVPPVINTTAPFEAWLTEEKIRRQKRLAKLPTPGGKASTSSMDSNFIPTCRKRSYAFNNEEPDDLVKRATYIAGAPQRLDLINVDHGNAFTGRKTSSASDSVPIRGNAPFPGSMELRNLGSSSHPRLAFGPHFPCPTSIAPPIRRNLVQQPMAPIRPSLSHMHAPVSGLPLQLSASMPLFPGMIPPLTQSAPTFQPTIMPPSVPVPPYANSDAKANFERMLANHINELQMQKQNANSDAAKDGVPAVNPGNPFLSLLTQPSSSSILSHLQSTLQDGTNPLLASNPELSNLALNAANTDPLFAFLLNSWKQSSTS